MATMKPILLLAALLCTPLPALAEHGTPFPLTTLPDTLARGTDIAYGSGQCKEGPVMAVSLELDGRQWLFFSGNTVPPRWVWLEYSTPEGPRPTRAWIGAGAEDAIKPTQHFENPSATVPGGPCSLVYPATKP